MILSELRDTFWRDVQDQVEPHLFAASDVDGWINEAIEEACIRARLIYETSDPAVCEISINPLLNGVRRYPIHAAINEIVYASITDAAGVTQPLAIRDWREADRLDFKRRTETRPPRAILHHDTAIELDCIPDAAYTMRIEVYRGPLMRLSADSGAPEIGTRHHLELLHWTKHKAYSIPDADTFDANRAADFEGRFEKYFGKRPDASLRKRQNANTPHRNKPCW